MEMSKGRLPRARFTWLRNVDLEGRVQDDWVGKNKFLTVVFVILLLARGPNASRL